MIGATWWIQATAGVNYYRAVLPARHLPGRIVDLGFTDLQQDASGKTFFPNQAGGSAVWLFSGNATRGVIMAEMQDCGYRVFMECDDNYLVPAPFATHSSWVSKIDREETDRHSFQAHRQIVPWCDGVIVATDALAAAYEHLNENVVVCRNCVDPDDWDPDPPHQRDGILHVGWAASDSHRYDAGIVARALDWASRQPNVEVVIVGIQPGISRFKFPHRHIPWTDDLGSYWRNVAEIDLMLCPLKPGVWANCKSDVKVMEAAMGGACSIVQDAPPFSPWFDQAAYVAGREKDFLKLVKHLVANRDEVAESTELAKRYVLEERTIQLGIDRWKEVLCIPPSTTTETRSSLSTTSGGPR